VANQTSERVARLNPKSVLVGIQGGCLFESQLCETLESNLRASLTNSISGIQFVNRGDVAQLLKKRGYLSIDVYEESLIRRVASEMGADIVVIENLTWEPRGYELTSKIVKVSGDKEVSTFKINIARSAQDTDDKPILVKDTETGVTLVIPRQKTNHSPPLYFPGCLKCPDPAYPEDARKKGLEGVMVFLVTVSDKGEGEQIALVKTFDAGLTADAVQTLRTWVFKPAIGPDGKAFATRVPVEVTYRLLR
jgi:TonB family protein